MVFKVCDYTVSKPILITRFLAKGRQDLSPLHQLLLLRSDKVDHPVSTAIYFLLPTRNVSSLHCISYAETWHFYLGEPLTVIEDMSQDKARPRLASKKAN